MKKRILALVAVFAIFLTTFTGCSLFDGLFKAKSYKVTYDLQGGTSSNPTSFEKDDFFVLQGAEKAGYEFVGWECDDQMVTSVAENKDFYLKAIYRPATYTISYVLNGGINNPSNPTTYIHNQASIAILEPHNDTKTFVGWISSQLGISEPQKLVAIPQNCIGNVQLVAVWYSSPTISFDSNGGTNIPKMVGEIGESIPSIPTPTKAGCNFAGWFVDPSFNTPFTSTTFTEGDIKLYAKWESDNNHSLTLSASVNDLSESITCDHSSLNQICHGELVNIAAPQIIDNYIFIGWYNGSSLLCKFPTYAFAMPENDYTLVAHYETLNCVQYIAGNNDFQINISETATKITGNGITSLDYTLSGSIITINHSYLSQLGSGDFIFILNDEYYLLIEISNSLPASNLCPNADDVNLIDYQNEYFTLNGKNYNCVIDSTSKFNEVVKYIAMIKAPKYFDENATEYTFSDYFAISESYYPFFSANAKNLFSNCFATFSVPYFTTYKNLSYTGSTDYHRYIYGLTIEIDDHRLNSEKSTQPTFVVDDEITELTAGSRGVGFNDFFIEKQTKTELVETIYELENLEFGVKPTFNGTSSRVYNLYNKAKQILRTYVSDDMSDFEKVTVIYNYLAVNVTYDYVCAGSSSNNIYSAFTSYGALVDNLAVCDGFASAFRLLCLIEGIDAIECSGMTNTGPHAWNKVYIDGLWYGVDSTWARVTSGSKTIITHLYLFMDEDKLKATGHTEYEVSTNKVALGKINYYDTLIVGENLDHCIDSVAEAIELFKYYKNHDINSFEFQVSFEMSEWDFKAISDQISKGFARIQIKNSYIITLN